MDDTRNRILRATCKAVRQYGVDGVRIQNISELAGLSPGALYRYFDSKETLLEACFVDVDRRVAELFERIELDRDKMLDDPIAGIRDMWLSYFRFWKDRPDETVFYNSFRNTPGFRAFDKERDTSYFHALVRLLEQLRELFPGLRDMNQKIFCIHILGMTVTYARCVVEGILPDTEKTEDEVFRILIDGLNSFCCPKQEKSEE